MHSWIFTFFTVTMLTVCIKSAEPRQSEFKRRMATAEPNEYQALRALSLPDIDRRRDFFSCATQLEQR